MNYLLFDSDVRANLLPFTHTRPVADIRCGIMTMRERWEKLLQHTTATFTQQHLQPIFGSSSDSDAIYINGAVFGTPHMCDFIARMTEGTVLTGGGVVIAARVAAGDRRIDEFNQYLSTLPAVGYEQPVYSLRHTWDIFSLNDTAIRADYNILTAGRDTAAVPEGVTVVGNEHLFIEDGAEVNAGTVINASTGPVYIGKNATILEGVLIRGPLAVCENGVLKMGAKVYGATTIGNGCKVGGEISNVVFFADSNKGHDGYLGNSVIGAWCNLGADTNCSNLKNNYSEVRVWHESSGQEVSTGLTFCGLMMGDHSKCGINTMFNTGTVVGAFSNIYGGGFPPKRIDSFVWGGSDGFVLHRFEKAIETAERMMSRRNKSLCAEELSAYKHLYEQVKND